MAPQVSDEMHARIIVWHDEQHLSVQEIAGLVGCGVRTVYNILSYHCDYHTLRNPSTRGPHGANRSLDMGDMNYIESLIDAQPKIYLDEIQDKLLERRDVFVSISTLSCTLHQLSMTHKHVANEALERNELLRATWQAAYADIPADYCVWLDKQVWMIAQTSVPWAGLQWVEHAFAVLPLSMVSGILSYLLLHARV